MCGTVLRECQCPVSTVWAVIGLCRALGVDAFEVAFKVDHGAVVEVLL